MRCRKQMENNQPKKKVIVSIDFVYFLLFSIEKI